MSMYGYDVSCFDYGFSDPAINSSLYGNSLPIPPGIVGYDDDVYFRRPPPPRHRPPTENPSSPPKHRHDGTSPLPLGMDWSLPPRVWEGRNSVWPHDSNKKWSYCVTVPSWTITPSSDTVFFRVEVGIQSPNGITTTRGVLRRFNEFLKLYSELRKEFPKKDLPPTPPRKLMKMRSKTLLEERRSALESWLEKLLSDIDVSRTADVAIFLELEAAARQSYFELNEEESAANILSSNQFPSNSSIASDLNETVDLNSSRPEEKNYDETNDIREQSAEFSDGDSAVVLPSGDREKVNRVLTNVQQRLGTTKMDMDDLIARLNQEVIEKQYLTTKVKDLEMELETKSKIIEENMQQVISTERERSTKMQWDMEELRRKCMELESMLKTEQETRTHTESIKETAIEENEMLLKELDDAKKQVEVLRKQHDEVESKSKSDVKILVKEVKSLRTSHSDLKQELTKCLEENAEFEKEKQIQESRKVEMLHKCEQLHDRLQECSINFLLDEENKLMTDTSLSDAIDLLETSDTQINLLHSEAQLLSEEQDDDLKKLIGDILTENAKLRKQVNSVIRQALNSLP